MSALHKAINTASEALLDVEPVNARQRSIIQYLARQLQNFEKELEQAAKAEHTWITVKHNGLVACAQCEVCDIVRIKDVFAKQSLYVMPDGHGNLRVALRDEEEPCKGPVQP